MTLNSTAGLANGDGVTVSGVDPLLNGSFPSITVAGGNITYPDPVTQSVAVTSRSIAGTTTATINTANTHTFANGDQVTVSTGDARFDGSFTAAGGSGAGVLKYTIPAVTATLTNKSAAAGAVTLTTSATPGFETGDTVTVPGGLGLAYTAAAGSTVTLTGVNAGAKTFSYTPATFNTSSWSRVGTTITINSATANGLKTGDTVTVSAFGGMQACLNKANAPVTGVPSGTSFTYTDAGCAPPNGGNGKVALITAASSAASGTATLVTTPSLAGSGNVTAPAFIAANTAATGSAVLTDVPATAVSGLITPAWLPPVGAIASANFPGSPGNPVQYHPPDGTALVPGTYYGGICIGLPSGTTCNDANCAAALTTQAYSGTAPTLSAAITATQTSFAVTQQKIAVGDVINIGTEDMMVNAVVPIGGTGQTLTVTRGYMADTTVTSGKGGAAAHASAAAISKVVSSASSMSVSLGTGIYIMAGGGFHICGSANVSAPHVLLFNSADPAVGTGNGALSQIELFTLGNVLIGPQTTGLYAGLTIFQDHTHEFNAGQTCDTKSKASSSWDIALVAAATTGVNGPLGSISGSIYAHDQFSAKPRDDFGDGLSGTATLAVMTDCIFIDGANSTFNFTISPGHLFGLDATLSG